MCSHSTYQEHFIVVLRAQQHEKVERKKVVYHRVGDRDDMAKMEQMEEGGGWNI